MIRTNKEKLVRISVVGTITPPTYLPTPPGHVGSQYLVSASGVAHAVPMAGGIVYNVKVGDPAIGWAADHLSPGVSIKNDNGAFNVALNAYACIGNQATVMSGDANSATGVVTGKYGHGGHVILHFDDEILSKLAYGDKVQIKASGVGLEFTEVHGVQVRSLSAELAEALDLEIGTNGALRVPVRASVPATLIGSGHGHTSDRWDLDIQTSDEEAITENNLQNLRLGDVVAIHDYDTTYSNFYRRGAMTIGVVSQGDSFIGGHGVGVTPIMASSEGRLEPVHDERSNIALLLGLRAEL